MSKSKRAIDKQKKQNSPKRKAKQAKKNYYASPAAKEAWEKKKEKRDYKKFTQGS